MATPRFYSGFADEQFRRNGFRFRLRECRCNRRLKLRAALRPALHSAATERPFILTIRRYDWIIALRAVETVEFMTDDRKGMSRGRGKVP